VQEQETTWYRLDNAGKLFPSIANERFTTVFRMSATMKDDIDLDLLQVALNHMMKRMPYYRVLLKRGFFWYYFEKTDEMPIVEEERQYPCMYLDFKKHASFPFRVLFYERRISVEMTHCLSDGTGTIMFLKSLLVEYLKLLGIPGDRDGSILYYKDNPNPAEFEDSFKKYYNPTLKSEMNLTEAMHFPFPFTERGQYHVVTGIMPIKPVITMAKKRGVTLTTFFLSLYFEVLLDYIHSAPGHLRDEMMAPIAMNVPVNLRQLFPSRTMRNFFLSVTPSIDPKKGTINMDEIMSSVASQMKNSVTPERLAPFITRNIQSESSPFVKLMPLVMKDTFMPLVYNLFGENSYSTSISNVGRITMPDPLGKYIDRFSFIPSPSGGNKIKTTLVSFNDKLYFTLGKLTQVNVIEKLLFRKLVSMGIPVKIESGW
jgi:NRPS condensation-like uncharacterized protein